MDKLNADLHLRNEVMASRKKGGSRARSNDPDTAYHFNAFVPVNDEIWRLG